MRVIITGSRKYDNPAAVNAALTDLYESLPPTERLVLIEGGATGADELAGNWAESRREWGHRVDHERYYALWSGPCRDTCRPGHRRKRPNGSDYCPAAGTYRNQRMVDLGADVVLAFPGGTGTADLCRRARAAGIDVREVG